MDSSLKIKKFRKEVFLALNLNLDASNIAIENMRKMSTFNSAASGSDDIDLTRTFENDPIYVNVKGEIYENSDDDKPINLLLDEDGILSKNMSGWRHTFETISCQYRETDFYEMITTIRILKIFPENINKFLAPNVDFMTIEADNLRTVQSFDTFYTCIPKVVNYHQIDVSDFTNDANDDNEVSYLDPMVVYNLAKQLLLKTLLFDKMPKQGLLIDDNIFSNRMPFITPHVAFIIINFIPQCKNHSIVASTPEKLIIYWYMENIVSFNKNISNLRQKLSNDPSEDLTFHAESMNVTQTMLNFKTYTAILNYNVRPNISDFNNVIEAYRSHSQDFSGAIVDVPFDFENQEEDSILQNAIIEAINSELDMSIDYPDQKLQKMCYQIFEQYETTELKNHRAFKFAYSDAEKGERPLSRSDILCCIASVLINCMIVLYDKSGSYIMHTHWPTINALENFRIIAMKKNVISDVTDRDILTPAKFIDGKGFNDKKFVLKGLLNSFD